MNLDHIDETADRFDAAWKDGPRPNIEHFLGSEEGKQRSALIEELVKIDLEYRCRSGEKPVIEEYLRQFPELLDPDGSIPNALVLYARKVSDEFSDSLLQRDVQLRTLKDVNGQEENACCPNCGNTLPLVDGRAQRIACPACGNSFRVERERPPKFRAGDLPRVLGKFQLLELVGEGSFGTVYKARDAELDRIVAIKLPRSGYFVSPEDKQRFLREAKSAAQLVHPNIVQVHEIGREDDVPYIVSDFVAGQTLAQLLATRRPPFREAADLTAQIADALQYAHERGIVHRDVKPSNIMLSSSVSSQLSITKIPEVCATENGRRITDYGHPKLMDFGLARRDEGSVAVTLDGKILGTPAYMAPEQAAGDFRQVDGRSDVYSLGVILYQMLTGEHPFRGTTPMLLHQVLCDEPRPPRRLNDRIPRDLETICLKAMAKTPARRYATAGDLAADLRRYLKGEPIHARPVGNMERLWRWAKRNPMVAGLAAAVLTLLLLGTGISTYFALDAVAAKNRSERHLYDAKINLAQRYWESNYIGRMVELLEQTAPRPGQEDLAGWEWQYLWRLCHGDLRTISIHANTVASVAVSPDGLRLALAYHPHPFDAWRTGTMKDSELSIWDIATGEKVSVLDTDEFQGVAFSPQGDRLAALANDKATRLYDVASGRELKAIPSPGSTSPVRLSFSPDGNRLALPSWGETIPVWDLRTWKKTLELKSPGKTNNTVVYSPDGKQLASGDIIQAFIHLFDTANGRRLKTLVWPDGRAMDLMFSPNGEKLASAHDDGAVMLWDAATGRQLRSWSGHSSVVRSLDFSPDGRVLATGGNDGIAKMWDLFSAHEIRTLKGHTENEMHNVAFGPEGWQLITGGGGDGTVKIWDSGSDLEARTLKGHSAWVDTVNFSPDGQHVVSGCVDGTIKIWDVITGQEVMTIAAHDKDVNCVVYSPDSEHLASAGKDQTIKLWDAGAGNLLCTLEGHSDAVSSVVFNERGDLLASSSRDGTIKIWDTANGAELRTLIAHAPHVQFVTFSPDGKTLASAGDDRVVKLWDLQTGRELRTFRGHTKWVYGVRFSPDGKRLASASDDRTIRIWDVATGQSQTLTGHKSHVYPVAFSPDGRRLASPGGEGLVKVWDVVTGQELLTLGGHTDRVDSVAFSPDGTWLASASADKTIKLWDGRPLTQDVLNEREGLALVNFLFGKPLPKADVLAYIRNCKTISEAGRRKALELAERFHEEKDAERYHSAAWSIVRWQYLNNYQYQFALSQAQAACRMAPDKESYLTTLGAAQYRLGNYQDALAALVRSEQFNAGQTRAPVPANLAFLAMTHHHLEHKTEAAAYLSKLHECMKGSPETNNEEGKALLLEAEGLLQGK